VSSEILVEVIEDMIERDLEKQFVEHAESRGCLALKLRIDGQNGFPDRTVICPNGSVFFVEFKRPGGKLSVVQEQWIEQLQKMSGLGVVVEDIATARRFLDIWLGD